MNRTISLLVIDAHALVRQTLSERLDREPDLVVVGTASNADEAVNQAVELKPDVMLMDVDMPGMISFEAARTLRTVCADIRVVFLGAFVNDVYIDQALAVEAAGYLTKNEPAESIVSAVRSAVNGGAYFSAEVQDRIVVDEAGKRTARQQRSRVATLTPRELVVLCQVACGKSQAEIASTLHLSRATVRNHCASVMKKLDIHDRVGLSRFAIREGLVEA